MSCIYPMLAFPNKVTDKGKLSYIPMKVSDKELDYWINKRAPEIFNNPDRLASPILIPCGKCIGCRMEYSKEWAARCMLELKRHDEAWFVTLTYSDDEVPRAKYYKDSKELISLSLRKNDFTLFMKKVRREYGNGIRFFMAGEYGSNTLRPHYHAILFGIHLDDKKIYKQTDRGCLYNSEKLSKCWTRYDKEKGLTFRRGHVVIAECNWETCAYTARYTAKKEMTVVNAEFWKEFNMEPPFVNMSRRPGIGADAMVEDPEFFNSGALFFPKGDDIQKVSIPKYYLRKLEQEDPNLYEAVRSKRKLSSEISQRSILRSSGRQMSKTIEDLRENIIERSKALTRNEI